MELKMVKNSRTVFFGSIVEHEVGVAGDWLHLQHSRVPRTLLQIRKSLSATLWQRASRNNYWLFWTGVCLI